MESPEFSLLSSLRGDFKSENYILPHYKESYRLAIDCLVKSGRERYQEFLKGERIGCFLSEEELLFIDEHTERLPPQTYEEEVHSPLDQQSSSGTYWPMHSDVDCPELDLGWPDVMLDTLQTNIDMLFHPARQNNPTIKEVVRKNIQNARQVVAIVMDTFTDVDIFKEVVDASIRGVPVYILLDSFHLKSFFSMVENQDVKIQQLRNMRVRSVKGQSYLCRSGDKFHGAMQQKFILIDCHTVIYGSYSFTWSCEKIHLSMVQVITGHLVKSYDEEFRTLYARSSLSEQLEGFFQCSGPHGQKILPKSHSAERVEQRDQLRQTLDTVYRKTCEMKGMTEFEERLFEEEAIHLGPLIEYGISVHDQMPQFNSTEAMNYLKRHSYAGERQAGYMPPDIRPRASNWNISKETGNVTNNYSMDNYLHIPLKNRGQNLHPAYEQQVLSMHQNIPTAETTSKSLMRSLRIESYLQNPDFPLRDSSDYLDQFEPLDKANSLMQGRMRSSLVLRSTIPEQMELDVHSSSAAPRTPLHYSSTQWNPIAAGDNRGNNEEFMFKRKSIQILDDYRNNICYGPGRNCYQTGYASLGKAKGGHFMASPDIQTDSWYKRHSMVDTKSNAKLMHESSSQVHKAFGRLQVNRGTAGISAQNGYEFNLNEDQRSVSHYDVKSITATESPNTPNWQVPPSRTVSAAILHTYSNNSTVESNATGSHHLLKKNAKEIKSFLNIPENKEALSGTTETESLKSGDSTDTLTAAVEKEMLGEQERLQQRTKNPVRSSSELLRKQVDGDRLRLPNPHFRVEEHRHPTPTPLIRSTSQKKPTADDKNPEPSRDNGSWRKDQGPENGLSSRVEKKHSLQSLHSSQEKSRSFLRSEAATEQSLTRATRGHQENKLEKFFQRLGNLLHKNKQ